MSAAPGIERSSRALRRPAPAARRPALALVPASAAAPRGRTPFVVLVVTLLAAGLLGLLLLNTALAQDAFRLHTLKEDSRALADREQMLMRQVEAQRAPQALAEKAAALGMVPAGPPAFLRLPDGAVLGAETPAVDPAAAATPAPGADLPPATADAAPSDEPAPEPEAETLETPETAEPSETAETSGTAQTDGAAPDGAAPDGTAPDGTPEGDAP